MFLYMMYLFYFIFIVDYYVLLDDLICKGSWEVVFFFFIVIMVSIVNVKVNFVFNLFVIIMLFFFE